ncbi:MAG: hypothetical protein ACKV0T_30100, partial [Planctomycetales bacterium]
MWFAVRSETIALAIGLVAVAWLGGGEKTEQKSNPYYNPEEIPTVPQTLAGGSEKTQRMGEDWAEFLGPRGTGISGETGMLDKWPKEGPPVLW